jgi:hypothetical protein
MRVVELLGDASYPQNGGCGLGEEKRGGQRNERVSQRKRVRRREHKKVGFQTFISFISNHGDPSPGRPQMGCMRSQNMAQTYMKPA